MGGIVCAGRHGSSGGCGPRRLGYLEQEGRPHRAYFKYSGGFAPAAPVRYGGLLAGRIENLRVDPGDSTRIEIDFRVGPDIPLKMDSVAKISSLGALGEYYLEVTTGSKDAPSPPGSVLNSQELVGISRSLPNKSAALSPRLKKP